MDCNKIFSYMTKVRQDFIPDMNKIEQGSIAVMNPSFSYGTIGRTRDARYMYYPYSKRSCIMGVSTPETRANTSALLAKKDDSLPYSSENSVLIPSRANILRNREIDAWVGTYHLLSAAMTHDKTKEKMPSAGSFAVFALPREALYYHPLKNMKEILDLEDDYYFELFIHHKDDPSMPFGKSIEIINGYELDSISGIESAIFFDSIAGGRNMGAAIELVKSKLPSLKKAIIISPLNAWLGDVALLEMCEKEFGLDTVIACMGGFLMSDHERYYSPLPINYPKLWADQRDLKIHEMIFGKEIADKICAGGDWSGNFYDNDTLEELDGHLRKNFSTTLKEILLRSNEIDIKEIFRDFSDIVPISTKLSKKEISLLIHSEDKTRAKQNIL